MPNLPWRKRVVISAVLPPLGWGVYQMGWVEGARKPKTATTIRASAGSISNGLYRVVANLCLDYRRKRAHAPVALTAETVEPAAPEVAELESKETVARVQRAVAALPERQRMAVILHRYEGMSYREIAHATGWGEAAIESLLSRAYAALRIQLADLQSLT